MKYFNYATGLSMINKKFEELFGGPPRSPETDLRQRDMDLASSIQKVTEEIVIKIAKNILKETGETNLCMAGGVALNSVVNGILSREKIFENIWIQPASGDAGGAIGAALSAWFLHYNKKRQVVLMEDSMSGSYLGPEFTDDEIEIELKSFGAVYEKFSENDLLEKISNALKEGKAVGWMQGRMEFGPRALGSRSIIADPRSHLMQKQLNLKIKFRESFRPFAPSVLVEDADEWFEDGKYSPYMLLVTNLKKEKRTPLTSEEKNLLGLQRLNIVRSVVPAITHVDYSARIQTVNSITNPRYYSLISKFKEKTGCPIIVNTSFNIRGEPIICTPKDALRCFMSTELDVLSVGNFILFKKEQNLSLKNNYTKEYELD
jgi:carbamoyltransferase